MNFCFISTSVSKLPNIVLLNMMNKEIMICSPNHCKPNGLSNTLCNDISTSWKNDGVAFDPKVVVQSLTDLLREESAAQGKEVDDSFYQSLEELQTDPDFNTILTEFDDALNGKRNMMTIGMLVRWLVASLCFCSLFQAYSTVV